MKYVCFCYYEPAKLDSLSTDVRESIPMACKPHDDALNASGKRGLICGFTEPETWRSIRPHANGPNVTKGPFQSSQEPIGVFFIVDASDIDEAVKIASLHPSAHFGNLFGGGIEVRPCNLYKESTIE